MALRWKIGLPMYQINEHNDMFLKLINISKNILSCHPPLRLVESNNKKEQKHWLTKELRGLINEKYRLFNAWKKNSNPKIYKIYKSLRNSMNRKVKKSYQLQENNRNSTKTGSIPTVKQKKVTN